MKLSSPVVLGVLGVVAVLGGIALLSFSGCGSSGQAGATIKNEVEGEDWKDPPIDPNKVVDSQESWRKFVAQAKQASRMKAAEEFFQSPSPAHKLQVVFMPDEIRLIEFGNSKFKNVDPKRLYEVGIIRLAAKETWGGEGFQIREYELMFITPKRDGNWQYISGNYKVPKSEGAWKASPTELYAVEDSVYKDGYLRLLFVEPHSAAKAKAAAAASAGTEAPVEESRKP